MTACGAMGSLGYPCEVEAGHGERTAHAAHLENGGVAWWWEPADKESQALGDARKWRQIQDLLQGADKYLDVTPCSLCGAGWDVEEDDPTMPSELVHSYACELGRAFILAGCEGHRLDDFQEIGPF